MAPKLIVFAIFSFIISYPSAKEIEYASFQQIYEKLLCLEGLISEQQTEINDLKSANSNLESEMEVLKTKTGLQDAELNDFNHDITDLQDLTMDLQSDLSTLQNTIVSPHIGFSCHRDSNFDIDEGIISYSKCNINDDDMMTASNGTVKILKAGEYFLTFFAETRAVNHHFVFCNLIQKSGSDLIELGATLNDLKDGDENVDDYSSNSMSVIKFLNSGDELYVEANFQTSDSYLYGDTSWPYISFSGFLLK